MRHCRSEQHDAIQILEGRPAVGQQEMGLDMFDKPRRIDPSPHGAGSASAARIASAIAAGFVRGA